MFAVIETGGKQYRVSVGQKIKIEHINIEVGKTHSFDRVLLLADVKNVEIGVPYLKNASVEAKILNHGRSDKKIVFRYHSKTRYRKFKTHRQDYTELEITKVK